MTDPNTNIVWEARKIIVTPEYKIFCMGLVGAQISSSSTSEHACKKVKYSRKYLGTVIEYSHLAALQTATEVNSQISLILHIPL